MNLVVEMGMILHTIVILGTEAATGETTTVIVVIGDGMEENMKEERDITTMIANRQGIIVDITEGGGTTVKRQ